MHTKGTNHTMKKIHVGAINRKVRDDEKLFVEECDRKYNEKLVAIANFAKIGTCLCTDSAFRQNWWLTELLFG